MATTTQPAIFNRWGTALTITGYCGKVQPKWASAPLILLRVTYHDADGDREGFQFAVNLKADGGWQTIDDAVDAAPRVNLTAKEEAKAIKIAE